LIAAEIITDIIVIFSSKIEILSYHNKHKVEEVKKKSLSYFVFSSCVISHSSIAAFSTTSLLL